MPWEIVRRNSTSNVGNKQPAITLRARQIAYNAAFIRVENLEKASRVTIQVDMQERRLGFRFHSDETDMDSLAVVPDGGSGATRIKASRITQAQALLQQPWLRALLRNRSVHRFSPYREGNLYVIDLGPSFEVEVTDPLEVPADITGVYRYLDGDEVTYIGRGRIRDRMQDKSRQDWTYDRVQYTVLNNSEDEQRWEQTVLAEYETKHGRLPRENRVRGYISTGQDEDN